MSREPETAAGKILPQQDKQKSEGYCASLQLSPSISETEARYSWANKRAKITDFYLKKNQQIKPPRLTDHQNKTRDAARHEAVSQNPSPNHVPDGETP